MRERDWLSALGVGVLLGLGLCVQEAPELSASAVWLQVERTWEAAFGAGVWLRVAQGAGLASLVFLGLTLIGGVPMPRRKVEPKRDGGLRATGLHDLIAETRTRIEAALPRDGTNVVAVFDEIVAGAVQVGASDVHVSPTRAGVAITYRVQGSLHEVALLPAELAPRLTVRAKVLARLDIHALGTPQDGRAVMEVRGERVDARVSSLPTELGERIVLRLVRGAGGVMGIGELGLSEGIRRGLEEVLSRSQGMFLVNGAVGSGKTTTLYACLKSIAERRGATTSIVTLEDPIEAELPFATQTQIASRTGMTFATTLRSVLRQDPNVLMVGEIRDQETAQITLQAGLTGHLILTTVHAESAASPFARLHELEADPFNMANAVIGCLSQRLVRTLCLACRRPAEPPPEVVEELERHGVHVPAGRYYEPTGCEACEGLGFAGRVPIAELLVLQPESRRAVHERRATSEIYEIALREGMTPLLADGVARAAAGETSLQEVLRVAR